MGNLGGPEILVILLVALMVLGPKKLPEAARQIGKAVTELRRMSSGFQQEMRDAMVDPEIEQQARDLRKKLKDPLALKENLLSGGTPPKSPPALAADPTPPKSPPALAADPTPPKSPPALAADPTPPKSPPALAADPTPPKSPPAQGDDPIGESDTAPDADAEA